MIENNNKWRKITIGDLGKIVTGKTPSTKNDTFWNGDIPFVTPADLQKTKHVFSTERTVSQDGLTAVKGATLPTGAICVSCIGNLGYTAMTTHTSVTNQQINSIIPSVEFDKNFVYYLMKSLWDEFKNLEGQSTTLSILNKTLFSKIEVSVPDLETQQQIAKVLSSLDDKIELNTQINHNLEEQAKAIFKSWFVDFEPFQDERFVETEYGSIPKSWRLITLGEVTEEIRTKVKNKTTTVFSAIKTGELTPSEEYFTKQVYSKDISKYIEVAPLTFAYNPARVNIGSLGLNKFPYTGCVSPVYVVFKSESEYHHFLDFTFKRAFFREEVRVRASGSVRQSLSYADFSLIKIIYPPNDVVEKFNQIYGKISASIRHNQKEIQTLALLRDTLLPKLMSGELDISEVQV